MSSEPVSSPEQMIAGACDADLLIVADPVDAVAVELAGYVGEHGRSARIVDVFDAARMFTVTVRGRMARVEPDLPIFLRLPPLPAQRVSFDAEFQYDECLAQLWAASALMSAPVINRPAPRTVSGRTSPSAALTELRAGEASCGVEVFSSRYPVPTDLQGEQFWVEDLSALRTSPWPERPVGTGPYRARWSDANPAFEMVVVLCGRAWRCTTVDIDYLGLEQRSIAVVKALDLSLAAVVWRVTAAATEARLVNVDPLPGLEQLRMVWLGLGPCLLEVLFS